MSMYSIRFIAMAGKKIGMGHLTRMTVLQKEFAIHKFTHSELNLVCPDEDITLGSNVKMFTSLQEVMAELISGSINLIIIDGPINSLETQILTQMRTMGNKVLIVNDANEYLETGTYDKMICCSVKFYLNNNGYMQKYMGPEYVILDPQFSKNKSSDKYISNTVKNVIMTFGGTDPGRITPLVLGFLTRCRINSLVIDVVIGAHSDIKEEELELLCGNSHNVRIHRGISNMAEKLGSADLAIISGGMTLYEACLLGTPTITINQNDEQQEEAEIFSHLGAVINLGKYTDLTFESFEDVINRMASVNIRRDMSNKANQIIDGKGVNRIIEIIKYMGNGEFECI